MLDYQFLIRVQVASGELLVHRVIQRLLAQHQRIQHTAPLSPSRGPSPG